MLDFMKKRIPLPRPCARLLNVVYYYLLVPITCASAVAARIIGLRKSGDRVRSGDLVWFATFGGLFVASILVAIVRRIRSARGRQKH